MTTTGVFTTLKITNGIPLFLERHQARLLNHAQQSGFILTSITLEDTIRSWLKKNTTLECALKISITGNKNNPDIQCATRPLPSRLTPLAVITLEDTRDETRVLKSIDRTSNEKAKKNAEEQGADDAIFVQDGFLIESTVCNIFSVNTKGDIITPPIAGKGLEGIQRQIVREEPNVYEEPITKTTTRPVVLTNSLRIQQVRSIDGRELENGDELYKRITIVQRTTAAYITHD